jgi:hypothetical protein
MTGRITTCDHSSFDLPALLTWDVTYTGTVPCDSFAVTCLYTASLEPVLRRAAGFTLLDEGNVLLRGIVDEYEIRQTEEGLSALVAGRGYAARLLDNESRAATYQGATLGEIVRNHVTPYGITCDQIADISSGEEMYTVAAGSSQWKALEGFCRTYGGFIPTFDRYGQLWATPKKTGETFEISDSSNVLSVVKREDHYGVLSEMLVIDKTRGQMYSVRNEEWIARGGQCRRVLYTPGQSTWAKMRYTGEYQIAQSKADEACVEVTLAGGFLAFPGDVAALKLKRTGLTGTYHVTEAQTRADGGGESITLTLREQ